LEPHYLVNSESWFSRKGQSTSGLELIRGVHRDRAVACPLPTAYMRKKENKSA
jgi:hypothetical protein